MARGGGGLAVDVARGGEDLGAGMHATQRAADRRTELPDVTAPQRSGVGLGGRGGLASHVNADVRLQAGGGRGPVVRGLRL